MVDKNTKIYCSFSKEAGNKGCRYFNISFEHYRLNALYKSFSINNIEEAVKAARCLNFSGFAVSMPFKKEVINFIDDFSDEVKIIGSANTVLNKEGRLIAHNTDHLAAAALLTNKGQKANEVIILGDGGYAAAVKYAASKVSLQYKLITRANWDQIKELKKQLVFNCTPVKNIKLDKTNIFIDCDVNSNTGRELGLIQASHQFKLYTGLEAPQIFH